MGQVVENIIAAIGIGIIAGVVYYIFKNLPPGGGMRGRMA